MQIFKFGGASVRNSQTISKLKNIILQSTGEIIIIISAMGKTTSRLESLLNEYFKAWFNIKEKDTYTNFSDIQNNVLSSKKEFWDRNKAKVFEIYTEILEYHNGIIEALKLNQKSKKEINKYFELLKQNLEFEPSINYDFEYDKIISYGELISTQIISHYLNEQEIANTWFDIRKCLKTGAFYRDARVDWKLTEKLARRQFTFVNTKIYVTQGFIGSTENNQTTTLGREGSDFSASILAYVLNAENVTIWKDVEGVYNADPKLFHNTELLEKISYHEAIEQTYYGAKVIHPKTIKPLQNKKIPLYVKSFENPKAKGTLIHSYEKWNRGAIAQDIIPVFICKNNQALIKIVPFDYSFIAEDNLSRIFSLFAKYRIRINLMQNSAISFMACFDNDPIKTLPLVKELSIEFESDFLQGFQLLTVRHYNELVVNKIIGGRSIIIEERNKITARYLLR